MTKQNLEEIKSWQELFTIAIGFIIINAPDLLRIVNEQRINARRGLQ